MKNLLRKFIHKLPDSQYVFFKNCQFKLKEKDIRYKKQGLNIIVTDHWGTWLSHRKRVHLYTKGLMVRGESIGKSYLLSEINFSPGDLVIDCGANMGDLLLYFTGISKSIKYVGFEPTQWITDV
jgi:hypothetical protein